MAVATRSVGRLIWPAVCLFQLGLILGWIMLRSHQPALPLDAPSEGVEMHSSPPPTASTLSPAQLNVELSRADDLLRQGRYDQALAAYQDVLAEGAGSLAGRIRFRQAIALEGLGRWDLALASYRKVAGLEVPPPLRVAAEVGQARIWIHRKRPNEARPLLCRLLLRTGRPEVSDLPALAEARYLLALALSHIAVPQAEPGPLVDAPARIHSADWVLARLLDAESAPNKTALKPQDKREDLLVVKRVGAKIEEHAVRAHRQMSAPALIAQLADQAGLRVQWTDQARDSVEERSVEIALDNRPFADVLWTLTGAFGLVWRVTDGTLVLSREDELQAEVQKAYRANAARYALRAALVTAPDHPLASVAYVELGAIDLADGKWIDAAAWFERASRDLPRVAQRIEAHYNLGWTLRRLGEPAAARLAFYRAIDHTPSHDLAGLAYLHIGQMFLEAGHPRQAIAPLHHALSAGSGMATEPWAAVTLSAAYLQSGQPRDAHQTLAQHRAAVARAPYQAVAAFLDALARYRLAAGGRGSTSEGSDLLSAVLALPDTSILGASGVLLQGQAYREIGLGERMAEIFQAALPKLKGALADEMICDLGKYRHGQGNSAEARRLLTPVAGNGHDGWAGMARLMLAEMDLEANHAKECLQVCAALLDEKVLMNRDAVLRLMGRAYEHLGDHAHAARCFAGQRPD